MYLLPVLQGLIFKISPTLYLIITQWSFNCYYYCILIFPERDFSPCPHADEALSLCGTNVTSSVDADLQNYTHRKKTLQES